MLDADIQIIKALKNRELNAYRDLFFTYYPRLVLFANKFTNDMDAAKDIVQDTFTALWEKAESLTIERSPSAYLFQIVRNKSLNYKRHQDIKRNVKDEIRHQINECERRVYADFKDPFHSLLEAELDKRISCVIEMLPEKCRDVFKMSRKEQLKNREIADKLGISVKMVEKYISKAIRVLRTELIDYVTILSILFFLFAQNN
jgi:RNA polymerase sigma-70 factor (ECF subfamily)